MRHDQEPPIDPYDPLPEANHVRSAEQAFLGALLDRPERVTEATTLLNRDDFANPDHMHVWDAITSITAAGAKAEPELVLPHLLEAGHRNAGTVLGSLVGVGGHGQLDKYASIILAESKVRGANYAVNSAQHALRSLQPGIDPTPVLERVVEILDGQVARFGATPKDEAAELRDSIDQERRRLEVREAALREHRAAKVAATDFDQEFLTRSQLATLPAPDPLIDRVLPRHTYGILRGRDHSFKSFVAIDWACCLATGKAWQGHQAVQVPVLYIVGEGAHGLSKRVDAWEYAWGQTVTDDMLRIRKTALNLHQPGPAFDHLLAHIEQAGYGLVIVDTLRRVSGGADGNGSEMGLVVDNLDRIRRATTNGTVLAVAHTDKGDNDTRGYSGIEDDADFVWAAKRDGEHLTLDLTKMKDGLDGTRVLLVANSTLRSLTLSGTDGPAEIDTTPHQLAILDALRIVPSDSATSAEIRSVSKLAKTTYYEALEVLVRSGQVIKAKRGRSTFLELPNQVLAIGPLDTSADIPVPDMSPDLFTGHVRSDENALTCNIPTSPDESGTCPPNESDRSALP